MTEKNPNNIQTFKILNVTTDMSTGFMPIDKLIGMNQNATTSVIEINVDNSNVEQREDENHGMGDINVHDEFVESPEKSAKLSPEKSKNSNLSPEKSKNSNLSPEKSKNSVKETNNLNTENFDNKENKGNSESSSVPLTRKRRREPDFTHFSEAKKFIKQVTPRVPKTVPPSSIVTRSKVKVKSNKSNTDYRVSMIANVVSELNQDKYSTGSNIPNANTQSVLDMCRNEIKARNETQQETVVMAMNADGTLVPMTSELLNSVLYQDEGGMEHVGFISEDQISQLETITLESGDALPPIVFENGQQLINAEPQSENVNLETSAANQAENPDLSDKSQGTKKNEETPVKILSYNHGISRTPPKAKTPEKQKSASPKNKSAAKATSIRHVTPTKSPPRIVLSYSPPKLIHSLSEPATSRTTPAKVRHVSCAVTPSKPTLCSIVTPKKYIQSPKVTSPVAKPNDLSTPVLNEQPQMLTTPIKKSNLSDPQYFTPSGSPNRTPGKSNQDTPGLKFLQMEGEKLSSCSEDSLSPSMFQKQQQRKRRRKNSQGHQDCRKNIGLAIEESLKSRFDRSPSPPKSPYFKSIQGHSRSYEPKTPSKLTLNQTPKKCSSPIKLVKIISPAKNCSIRSPNKIELDPESENLLNHVRSPQKSNSSPDSKRSNSDPTLKSIKTNLGMRFLPSPLSSISSPPKLSHLDQSNHQESFQTSTLTRSSDQNTMLLKDKIQSPAKKSIQSTFENQSTQNTPKTVV